MDPEQQGGGMMGSKIMGIPSIIWIGIIALVVYFLFFRNASKSGSTTPGAQTETGGSGTITTGATTIDSGAVQVTVQGANNSPGGLSAAQSGTGASNAQSQPQPPTTGTSTTSSGSTPVQSTVKVPNVVGQRANFGIGELDSLGLSYRSTTGDRNPSSEYNIASQQPAAGTMVPKGSVVSVAFKKI